MLVGVAECDAPTLRAARLVVFTQIGYFALADRFDNADQLMPSLAMLFDKEVQRGRVDKCCRAVESALLIP